MKATSQAQLASDATVDDLPALLEDPVRWFRDLINTFAPITRTHPDAYVRIGVTGEGHSPNYMITYKADDGSAMHRCRDGLHTEVDWEVHPSRSTWSAKSSSLTQVQAVFRTLPDEAFKKAR